MVYAFNVKMVFNLHLIPLIILLSVRELIIHVVLGVWIVALILWIVCNVIVLETFLCLQIQQIIGRNVLTQLICVRKSVYNVISRLYCKILLFFKVFAKTAALEIFLTLPQCAKNVLPYVLIAHHQQEVAYHA